MISRTQAGELLSLLSALKRATGWTDQKTYAPLDMGPLQVRLLEYLAGREGVSQSDLSRATATDKALAGRALASLMDRGWLVRKRNKLDGRAYIVRLTPSGHKLAKQLEVIRSQIIDRLTQALDETDVEAFRKLVSKLLTTMNGKKPVA
jgi:DNA-binding MarR family transcriptional regulator